MGPDWVKPVDSGENTGDGAYVPTPTAGAVPVKGIANRRDMDVAVVWKNSSGAVIPDLMENCCFWGN
jgi:hypothetical protein